MKLKVYTDGACSGNPGPGGWACLYLFPEEIQLISGGAEKTTNNRMELIAVVQSLEQYLDRYCYMGFDAIEIHSDSAYIVNSINQGWVQRWKENKWCSKNTGPIRNYDLWRRLYKILEVTEWLKVPVYFIKVEGHAGIECNEIVDKAAREEVLKIKGRKVNG